MRREARYGKTFASCAQAVTWALFLSSTILPDKWRFVCKFSVNKLSEFCGEEEKKSEEKTL